MNVKKIPIVFVIGVSVLFCAGCSYFSSAQPKALAKTQGSLSSSLIIQPYILPYFDKVVINGNFAVSLLQQKRALNLYGYGKDIAKCSVSVRNRTLYLLEPKERFGYGIHVSLSTDNLRLLETSGSVHLIAGKYNGANLRISAVGNASVKMTGVVGISSISQQGNGKIEISWVQSNDLNIIAEGRGLLLLSGVAKKVYARLADGAVLDAKYLRTKNTAIVATDNASAYVVAEKNLDAYAGVNSNIYYYERPKHINVVTRDSGNVLHL